MNKREEFASWLKELIKEKGYSTVQLGKLVGCSQSNISHWSNGKGIPRAKYITPLASHLGIQKEMLEEKINEIKKENKKVGKKSKCHSKWKRLKNLVLIEDPNKPKYNFDPAVLNLLLKKAVLEQVEAKDNKLVLVYSV